MLIESTERFPGAPKRATAAELAAQVIQTQRRMDELLGRRQPPQPRYVCNTCGRETTQPSVTDASDYYHDADGNLAYQHRHWLVCPACFSMNIARVAA